MLISYSSRFFELNHTIAELKKWSGGFQVAIKIGLVNGETIFCSGDDAYKEFTKKLNNSESEGVVVQGRELKVEDISYFTEVTTENRISVTLATIEKKSHMLSFDRGKTTKGSYIVPVYVSVEFDEETGEVKDIRLDGMKEYLMKHI